MIWDPCPSDALAGERAEDARILPAYSSIRATRPVPFEVSLRRIDLEERAIACRRGLLKIQEDDLVSGNWTVGILVF